MTTCAICHTITESDVTTKHHVLPKSKGGRHKETIICCPDCGKQVHILFNEKELASMSLDELLKTEEMIKYIKWKRTHPGNHKHRMSKKVRQWKRYHR